MHPSALHFPSHPCLHAFPTTAFTAHPCPAFPPHPPTFQAQRPSLLCPFPPSTPTPPCIQVWQPHRAAHLTNYPSPPLASRFGSRPAPLFLLPHLHPPSPLPLPLPPALQVRQRGREALQQALYRRSEGRYKARSVGKMAANLCGLLMGDLEATRGKKQLVTAASAGGGEKRKAGCLCCVPPTHPLSCTGIAYACRQPSLSTGFLTPSPPLPLPHHPQAAPIMRTVTAHR